MEVELMNQQKTGKEILPGGGVGGGGGAAWRIE